MAGQTDKHFQNTHMRNIEIVTEGITYKKRSMLTSLHPITIFSNKFGIGFYSMTAIMEDFPFQLSH